MDRKIFSILVVDDEQVVRDTVSRILMDEGFNVSSAEDGRSAVEAARNRNFDAALLDLKLPDINGIEVLERIKIFNPDIKAVIMTAYEIKELVNRAFELGAFTCLHKPFEIKKLLQIFNEMKQKDA
jgi:two-component system, response regulator, stage 0 sporulation protein F